MSWGGGKVIYHLSSGPEQNEVIQVTLNSWIMCLFLKLKCCYCDVMHFYLKARVHEKEFIWVRKLSKPAFVHAQFTNRCNISLNGNVYQITVHKSLHGNVRITSPKWKNAYVCACVCFLCCMWVCVPKCESVCLLPSNKWCMCKLGKFLLYLVMQIFVEYLLWSHSVTYSPMKQNKDLLKTAPLMCWVNAWVHSLRVQLKLSAWLYADVSITLYTDTLILALQSWYPLSNGSLEAFHVPHFSFSCVATWNKRF